MKFSQPIIALFLLLFLTGGCASTTSQNWGKIEQSGEITQLVESATVLSDHTYYYTGPQAEPDAIIAIDNQYTLQSKYWIKVDDVAKQLNDWNRIIDNAHRVPGQNTRTRTRYSYEGAKIMTPDGKEAGIWYSRHDSTVVQFPDPSSIIIYAPVVPAAGERPLPRRDDF